MVSRIVNEAETTHKLSSVVRDETHTCACRVYESAGLHIPSLCATYRCHREQGSSSMPYEQCHYSRRQQNQRQHANH